MDIILDKIEVRVLGSLMEKELATPEYYPLSLNALTNACNQKTNRLPVLSLGEDSVVGALQSLKKKRLVGQSDTSRVAKYWHDFIKQNNLIRKEAALLCLLLLRGHQTAGELRSRTERLCSFENLEEVFQYLDNLSEIGFVVKLPLQPGQKEQRFAHLLSGEPENIEQIFIRHEADTFAGEHDNDRIAELEKSVAYLKEEIEILKNEFFFFKKEFE
ncbi:MAG: YceH family protein [Proteobacteria bacterium]|nr:YceH family protein [Pseudomonadota bacterium]